jgi:hypothetical protein
MTTVTLAGEHPDEPRKAALREYHRHDLERLQHDVRVLEPRQPSEAERAVR